MKREIASLKISQHAKYAAVRCSTQFLRALIHIKKFKTLTLYTLGFINTRHVLMIHGEQRSDHIQFFPMWCTHICDFRFAVAS